MPSAGKAGALVGFPSLLCPSLFHLHKGQAAVIAVAAIEAGQMSASGLPNGGCGKTDSAKQTSAVRRWTSQDGVGDLRRERRHDDH